MKKASINGSDAEVTFENIPFGHYCAFALHDEDGNSELEYVGSYTPDEGIGMTNDLDEYKKSGGIPVFDSGKSLLDKEKFEVELEMLYY